MYRKESDTTGVKEVAAIHQGDGIIKVRGFFEEASRLPVKFHVWELDPGVSEGDHIHDDLEECYYFTQGSGVMTLDGQHIPVSAGDAILAPPGCDHGMRNTGSTPLKVVLIWGQPQAAPRD